MIEVNIKGHAETAKQVRLFGRNLSFAIARALTYTARDIKKAEAEEIQRSFDRPTAYTLNSLFITPATKDKLSAKTWVKDDRATSKAGTPANRFLLPNVEGGKRGQKRFERVLQMSGFLPGGWVTVAGQGANLDGYGNISRGQLTQILSQLKINTTAGYDRAMKAGKKGIAAQRRAGGRFFVVNPGKRIQAGIYQREFYGKNITPVIIFTRQATYKPRFDFYGVAQKTSKAVLEKHLETSFAAAYENYIPREQITLF